MKDIVIVLLIVVWAVFGCGGLLWMLDCLEAFGKLVC